MCNSIYSKIRSRFPTILQPPVNGTRAQLDHPMGGPRNFPDRGPRRVLRCSIFRIHRLHCMATRLKLGLQTRSKSTRIQLQEYTTMSIITLIPYSFCNSEFCVQQHSEFCVLIVSPKLRLVEANFVYSGCTAHRRKAERETFRSKCRAAASELIQPLSA